MKPVQHKHLSWFHLRCEGKKRGREWQRKKTKHGKKHRNLCCLSPIQTIHYVKLTESTKEFGGSLRRR